MSRSDLKGRVRLQHSCVQDFLEIDSPARTLHLRKKNVFGIRSDIASWSLPRSTGWISMNFPTWLHLNPTRCLSECEVRSWWLCATRIQGQDSTSSFSPTLLDLSLELSPLYIKESAPRPLKAWLCYVCTASCRLGPKAKKKKIGPWQNFLSAWWLMCMVIHAQRATALVKATNVS